MVFFWGRPGTMRFRADPVEERMVMVISSGTVLFPYSSCQVPGLGSWAASLGHLADRAVEQCLGAYPSNGSCFWTPPEFWDADDLAMEIEDHPSV